MSKNKTKNILQYDALTNLKLDQMLKIQTSIVIIIEALQTKEVMMLHLLPTKNKWFYIVPNKGYLACNHSGFLFVPVPEPFFESATV